MNSDVAISSRTNSEPSEKFMQLKASLLRQGRLYEDPEFPSGPQAIGGTSSRMFDWRRPGEICRNPVFVTDGMSTSDLFQGELQNCWFIAAAACMATAHEALLARCIPEGQNFDHGYAGIFCFNFWHFGKNVEVIIDDRLPTRKGKLVFAANRSQENEFWVPLFEKAYAKLYGSYRNLEGGFTNNALVDFTGGISEMIDLKTKRTQPGFYDEMYEMMKRSSMLGAHINGNYIDDVTLPSGLQPGHAYSILNLVRLKHMGAMTMLIQLRNPWGKKEWNGAWCDSSLEWTQIPKDIKDQLNMVNKEDGDFWMSFEDFVTNFEFVTICHLTPESTDATFSKGKKKWKDQSFEGQWLKGFSAGGCGQSPNEKLFFRNPQYSVSVDQGAGSQSSMVISLMQNSANQKNNLYINFKIFRVIKPTTSLLSYQNVSEVSEKIKHPNSTFVNMREVSDHFVVEAGNYFIVPCTYEPNETGEFLLRVFTEEVAKLKSIDVATTLQKPVSPIDKDLEKVFEKSTNGDERMDANELVNAANEILMKDGLCWMIGLETARSLINLIDDERIGTISLVDFRKLLKELTAWKEKFKFFDRDLSGDIDTFELSQIFNSIGFTLSRKVQESIFRRYGGKKCRLSFEDFVHSCSKIVGLYGAFIKNSSDGVKGKATFNLEDWLATTSYF